MKGCAGSAWPTATPMQTRDGWSKDDLDAARAKAKAKAQNGNGFGLGLGAAASQWPTPMAGTPAQNGNSAAGSSDFSRKAGMWKTPSAQEPGVEHRTLVNADGTPWTGGERAYDQETGRLVQTGLPQMVKANAHLWTTPQAHDVTMRGSGQKPTAKAGNACLARDAAQWPPPAAQNVKGSSPDSVTRADGKSRMDILHYAAEQGFSRPDPETPPHGMPSSDPRRTWRRLRRLVISTHGRAVWKRMAASGGKRRLNPNFVAWLMAWPIGHPGCACSATEFSRWQQLMRGALSRLPTASGPWIWKPPAETQESTQMDLF